MLSKLKIGTLATMLVATGCDRVREGGSSTKDLAADRAGKNIVLMFGASNGLEGVATDLDELKTLFQSPAFDFGFEVRVIPEATSAALLSESAKAAADVGASGTLFWYYSGHGAEDGGKMFTVDQNLLPWNDVGRAMKAARSTPIKRLIVMSDSCFSGNLVDGTQQVTNIGLTSASPEAQASAQANAMLDAFSPKKGTKSYASAKLYDQLLVVSASRKSETSADLGSSMGGGFTYTMRNVLAEMKQGTPSATIRQFVEKTQSETVQAFGHTPQYRAEPEASVLDDALFSSAGDASGLYLGLGADKGGDGYDAMISAGANVIRVAICLGDKATCTVSNKADVAFGGGAAKDGRTLFRSSSVFAAQDGGVVTLLAYAADGALLDARSVKIQRQ